jgi:cob(I)alamin adenosyltransferase
MGHRLSRITTRTGDTGETGLGDGARVGKEACASVLGGVDELSSCLGLLLQRRCQPHPPALLRGQQDLFDLGGEVCIPATP